MILKIINKKQNKLLDRIEIQAELEFKDKTPTKEEAKKQLSKDLKTNENLIIVKNIYQKFGAQKAQLIANVYNSEENLKKFEQLREVTKKMNEEEPKPEEPKEEEPKEEPTEEPKEEPKEEEKKEETAEEDEEEAAEEPKEEEKEEEKKEEPAEEPAEEEKKEETAE